MGFGTLFIGYFFLINISYFAYTDIIGALIMLMGLYKLSPVNTYFKAATVASISFSVVALAELALSVIGMFTFGEWLPVTVSYVNAIRYAAIFALSYLIIMGIRTVSREVDANEIYRAAKRDLNICYALGIAALLEIPFLGSALGNALPYIYFVLLIIVVLFIFLMLSLIYKAYMQICMPEDAEIKDKKSRFEFLNRFYDRIEQKSREYSEYKMKAAKEKQNKRKK